ncbi:MAG TPA: phospholipase D-like domain-containing protein, partial [Kofleriaceae bacterium]
HAMRLLLALVLACCASVACGPAPRPPAAAPSPAPAPSAAAPSAGAPSAAAPSAAAPSGAAPSGATPSGAAPAAAAFELVETVPAGTTLDHPELRDAADVWLELITRARRSIDLGQFYASNHQPGRLEPIIAALEAAARRGVIIRFLVEQSFVKVYPDTLDRLARAGVIVRHLDLKAVPGAGGILHAKYFVIDGREAFFGSQNFDWRALDHNYELGARTTDPGVVAGLAAVFASDWARAGGEPAPDVRLPDTTGAIRFVASPRALLPPGVAWDLPAIIGLLDAARSTITVEALGYLAGSWDELEAPLRRAAARGVHVQLLLADWSKRKKTIGGLQQLARTPNIEVRLTTIPEDASGFIPFARVTHAKALVVDGARAWLGTSNWERDYFYATRNVGAIIDDPAIAAELARFFTTLWQSTYAVPVDPDARYIPPRTE